MTTRKPARASPEPRKAPLSPRYRRNYTTPRGTTRSSIVFEGVDLDRMKAILGSPEAAASKAEHTVIDPIEMYIEVKGGA